MSALVVEDQFANFSLSRRLLVGFARSDRYQAVEDHRNGVASTIRLIRNSVVFDKLEIATVNCVHYPFETVERGQRFPHDRSSS